MKRRNFLKGLVAGGGGAAHFSVHGAGAGQGHGAKPGSTVPVLGDSVYAGHRYEAVVPDTLDLAERAALAINGIGGTIDPDLNYYMFFFVRYACKTPYMAHHAADSTCDTKYGESFPMMRIMCGSDRYLKLEAAQRAELLSRIEDGLYWNRYEASRPWRTNYTPEIYGAGKNEDIASTTGQGRMLRTLVAWREISKDSSWDGLIRRAVGGLKRIAVHREDYSFYPDGGFGEPFSYPRSGWQNTDEPKSETEGGEGSVVTMHGHQIQGLVRWYAMSGDEEARDLAARLTRFCMLPKFWGGLPVVPEKRREVVSHIAKTVPSAACVAGPEMGHWYTHFHARAGALRGMLEYGMTARDERVLEFVRRAYEYTWTFGIPRIGWVNCYPGTFNLCEGCALGDLVALGIRLTDAGVGDYWDDVDAVVRNHLVEGQLVHADRLERVAAASEDCDLKQAAPHDRQVSVEDVIQRSLGNFAGHSAPASVPNPWVMQCCTGNGTQGLYYGWESIVRQSGESAQVNLLLNRAAPGLDVDSFLPYQGKVIIRNKQLRRISVRIPSWVAKRQIRSRVAEKERSGVLIGNFLMFDDLKPGDRIQLEFPIQERSAEYTANSRTEMEQTYKCTFRGSTVVDISPRDSSPTSYPLYVRQHMRTDKAPMKKTSRFVAERTISRW